MIIDGHTILVENPGDRPRIESEARDAGQHFPALIAALGPAPVGSRVWVVGPVRRSIDDAFGEVWSVTRWTREAVGWVRVEAFEAFTGRAA